MKHNDLKRGLFKSPHLGDLEIERYVIENEADLNAFSKKYPQIKNLHVYDNIKNSLIEGYIILFTDAHQLSGFPTYCFESKPENTHPSSIHRLRLL